LTPQFISVIVLTISHIGIWRKKLKKMLLVVLISAVAVPVMGQQFYFRATTPEDVMEEWAGVMVLNPPIGYLPTLYNFSSPTYSEEKCHVAFDMNGLAYKANNLTSVEEVAVVCLWAGLYVQEAYHRYTVFASVPHGKRAEIIWHGPSGDIIDTWLSPVGATQWDQIFLVQTFPTQKDGWNTVWRGYCHFIPEPGTWVSVLSGAIGVFLLKRKTKTHIPANR